MKDIVYEGAKDKLESQRTNRNSRSVVHCASALTTETIDSLWSKQSVIVSLSRFNCVASTLFKNTKKGNGPALAHRILYESISEQTLRASLLELSLSPLQDSVEAECRTRWHWQRLWPTQKNHETIAAAWWSFCVDVGVYSAKRAYSLWESCTCGLRALFRLFYFSLVPIHICMQWSAEISLVPPVPQPSASKFPKIG